MNTRQIHAFISRRIAALQQCINMVNRRLLTTLDRGRAHAWLQGGVGVREIGRRLGVSPSVVVRLRQRFQATGSVQDRPRSGRPRKTTAREDRYIARLATATRSTTASRIRQQLRTTSNINVCTQTVRNRLHAVHLRSRRPAVRPRLSAAHRASRNTWCRRHVTWTRRQWSHVMFTDESRFRLDHNDGRVWVWRRRGERLSGPQRWAGVEEERRAVVWTTTMGGCGGGEESGCLDHNDGRVWVWRRRGERLRDECINEVTSFGGGSVMVWAGFSAHHRTPLHHVQDNLNGQRYRDGILRPLVVPALQQIGQQAVLQDDNARPHRARVVNTFLQQAGVNRTDWPACSPDLNPIENLWDHLEQRVVRNQPPAQTLQQLLALLQLEWQAIPQHQLRRLTNSMRRRCAECIANRGGHTHY